MSYAISKLQQDNVWLYLDAGHSGWLGWPANISPAAQLFAEVLQGAGSGATVRGLATDVSNYNLLRGAEDPAQAPNPNYDEELYINALAPLLQQNNFPSQFIVDQGRSGVSGIRTAEGDWCNVLGLSRFHLLAHIFYSLTSIRCWSWASPIHRHRKRSH